jgi:putative ABC transport system substrate-binding protein
MRRREFIPFLVGTTVAWPFAAQTQPSTKVRRIGVLLGYNEDEREIQGWLGAFRESMEKLGWAEGQSVTFDYRWVGNDADLMIRAAKELIALQPDLILSTGSPTTAVLLKQTHTIPVLFANLVDPVGQGFVASLSRPGGNATGLVNLDPSMASKWIELLKQVAPQLTRVAIPFNPVSAPYAETYLKVFRQAASALGVEVIDGSVSDMTALEAFIAAQAREPNTGIIPMPSTFSSGHTSELAAMTKQYHLPGIYVVRSFASAGGLLSYGNDVKDNYERAGTFADKILRGAKPSDIPVQFPTKFNLVINLKTAKTLGLTVPLPLQASADELVD